MYLEKWVFTDVIKLSILKEENCPVFSGWALNAITCKLLKETKKNQRRQTHEREGDNVNFKAETGMMQSIKLEEARNGFSPSHQRECGLNDTLHLNFWVQDCERISLSFLMPHHLWQL